MKGYRGFILAGLIFYCLFLLATIPATFINTLIAHYLDKTIQLADARGTVWDGSGNLDGMNSIHWQVSVPELLLGRIHVMIKRDDAAPAMDFLMTSSRIEFKHIALTLPASLLSYLAQPLKLIAPGGQLNFSSEDFSISDTLLGRVEINWQNASSALSQTSPIGAYQFHLNGLGDHLDIRLDTQEGPLFLAGKGTWSVKDGMRFMGTASAKNEQLAALLNLVGKPAGEGIYTLNVLSH